MVKKVNQKRQTRTQYDIAFVVMAVVAFLIIIGTATYAYYQSTIDGVTSGTIAKWSFKANNQISTFDLDFGALYPGKTDVKYIELSAEDSELPIAFELVLNLPLGVFDENLEGIYGSFYKIQAIFNRLCFTSSCSIGPASDGTIGMKGILLAGEKFTIPLYYNWDYEYDDELQDAADGRSVENKITIIGRQLDISNKDNFNASMNTDLSDLITLSNCELGEYPYSNKYGWPCLEGIVEKTDAIIHKGETVNYELADGSVIELPKYMATAIITYA